MTKNANQKKAAAENQPHPTDILLNEEIAKWQALGMTAIGTLPQLMGQVPGVPIDTMKLEVMIVAIFESAAEQLGLDKDKVNDKFKELMLDKLRTIREANEDEVRRARIVPGQVVPELIIPENIRRKMH